MRMRWTFSLLFVSIFVILIAKSGYEVFAQSDNGLEPIKVVTKDIEPFVFVSGGTPSGFSIDLWEMLAEDSGLSSEYLIVETVQEQLDALENNEAGLAVGAITITEEREERVDFSHAYFISGLSILTHARPSNTLGDTLRAALSPNILRILAGLLLTIIIAAHIIWLVERRRQDDFPQSYLKGIWEGIWWSVVTVTTVGYGDKIPGGRLGRVFAILWMLTGLFLIANFTAAITSELTVQRLEAKIERPEDLYGKRVTTVVGSTADEWLTAEGIRHTTVATIEEAYLLLDAQNVQAVVYDRPVLLYDSYKNPDKNYAVSENAFNTEVYGFALPQGSSLQETINRALLRALESGEYDRLYNKWFGVDYD
ncbi:MAG: transporter substrate-binding domain-containing protein [Candidatus Promineifilaceae bacterium]|jgi:polar amino acid transport system substrate-binding protein